MTRLQSVDPRFVEFIPDLLDEGTLYVSIAYATAVHRCACGCGNEVVTPITPQDWSLVFDGETVSLRPSIGNWGYDCQSHYWIDRNRVHWARPFSVAEIIQTRDQHRRALDLRFDPHRRAVGGSDPGTEGRSLKPIWAKLRGVMLRGRRR